MIIWRGWGIVPVLLAIVFIVVNEVIASALGTHNVWVAAVLALAAGVATWLLGRRLNRPLQQAGVKFWRRHSFFWIPMEWWALPYVAAAIIILLAPH
jgi:hypothetical protein